MISGLPNKTMSFSYLGKISLLIDLNVTVNWFTLDKQTVFKGSKLIVPAYQPQEGILLEM